MRKKRLVAALILAVFAPAVAPSVFAQERPRLGILPFSGGTGGDGEVIATLLANQPEIRNAFVVVPRTGAINAVMAEMDFQRSGYTDSDTIAELGRMLNADYVVSGHIRSLGDRNLVIATIVGVESMEQLAGAWREYREIEEVRALLPDMTRGLIAATGRNQADLPRLAVAPFNVSMPGVNAHEAETLAQILAVEISNAGRFVVLPRTSTIQAALAEHDFQRSGLTAADEVMAIGQFINAEYVLSGEVQRLGRMNLFIAQVLNLQDGSLSVGADSEYTEITEGMRLMGELAGVLAGRPRTPAAAPPAATPAAVTAPATTTAAAPAGPPRVVTAGVMMPSAVFPMSSARSTARGNIAREVIAGGERTVIDIRLNLAGNEPWAQVGIRDGDGDNGIVARARTARGIRFRVLGDGSRLYIRFITPEVDGVYNWHSARINTRRNQVVDVDIPFSSLSQAAWGRRVPFNRGSIREIAFSIAGDSGTNSSEIQVFDISFY